MNTTMTRKTRLAAALALMLTPALAMAQDTRTQNDAQRNATATAGSNNRMDNSRMDRTQDPYARQTSSEGRDAYREGLIWGTYVANPALNAFHLGVDVQGDRATLTGRVESPVDKLLAERIAMRTQGVKQVDNRIQVDPLLIVTVFEPVRPYTQSDSAMGDSMGNNANANAMANSGSVTSNSGAVTTNSSAMVDRGMVDRGMADNGDSQRTQFARGVADDTLAAMVNSRLLWNATTDGTDINVAARNGVVTLTGRADTQSSKNMATRLAQGTRGVVRVDNRLTVDTHGQVVQAEAGEGDEAMSDTWVAAKINSSLMWSAGVDAGDIDVDVTDGRVTLSGTADSVAAKRQAVDLAGSVRGVKSVEAGNLRVETTVSQR